MKPHRRTSAILKAAIYVRVSDSSQREGSKAQQREQHYSAEDQEARCRAHAALREWDVADVYIDKGLSGRKEERKAFQRLLADARAQHFQVVIVLKFNRFARNARLQHQSAYELERIGVTIESVMEPINMLTSAGRFTFGMLASVAEFESEQIGERVSGAFEYKAEHGGWVGPVPIGYQKDDQQNLVPSEQQAAVRLAFMLYRSRLHSFTTIADELNAQGHRIWNCQSQTWNVFSKDAVRTILCNPVYIGKVKFRDQLFDGKHESLIDQATWDAVQEIRQGRGEKNGRIHTKPSVAGGGLLKDICFCATCGGRTWYNYSGNQRNWKYYICSNRSRRACQAPFSQAPSIEAQVMQQLMNLALPEDWQEEIIQRAERLIEQPKPTPAMDPRQREAKLARLKRVYLDGIITEEEYQAELAALRIAAPVQQERQRVNVRAAMQELYSLAGLVQQADDLQRRALLQQVFSHIWVEKHTVVAVTPTRLYFPLVAAVSVLVNRYEEREPGGSPLHVSQRVGPLWMPNRHPFFATL